MKKLINTAFGYAIASMAFGVFYREFTKWNGFTGKTTLAVNHLHLFALGTVLFLVLALFAKTTSLTAQPMFRRFYGLYNVALPFMTVMFTVRGVVQVLGTPLSSGGGRCHQRHRGHWPYSDERVHRDAVPGAEGDGQDRRIRKNRKSGRFRKASEPPALLCAWKNYLV